MTITIRNLTNIDFVLFDASGSVLRTIAKESIPAEVSELNNPDGEIDGIPIVNVEYGEIRNLPDPEEGTYFIVSSLVRDAVIKQARTDCLSPGGFIRENNKVIGCLFLKK